MIRTRNQQMYLHLEEADVGLERRTPAASADVRVSSAASIHSVRVGS